MTGDEGIAADTTTQAAWDHGDSRPGPGPFGEPQPGPPDEADLQVTAQRIAAIISNEHLAGAIVSAVDASLRRDWVHLAGAPTVWGVFAQALAAAARDIERHPRGADFRRLIRYGPLDEDAPRDAQPTGGRLSDAECGRCAEFVHAHMVNRFKGELAELLAADAVARLVERPGTGADDFSGAQLYWGDLVQERVLLRRSLGAQPRWGSFHKGADGLLVEVSPDTGASTDDGVRIRVRGMVEVKSMRLGTDRILRQIRGHEHRLTGGLRLGHREWPAAAIEIVGSTPRWPGDDMLRVVVVPAAWRLGRRWRNVPTASSRGIVSEPRTAPPHKDLYEEIAPSTWRVTLAWSEEALEEAAYEMTFAYMAEVGASVYGEPGALPPEWGDMTSEQAGQNAIKVMLYALLLRYLTRRQARIATKLYNVYGFSYPLGIDSAQMLWPDEQDFPPGEGPEDGWWPAPRPTMPREP